MDKQVTVYQRNQALDDFMAAIKVYRNKISILEIITIWRLDAWIRCRNLGEINTWLPVHESTGQVLLKKLSEIV